MKCIPSLHPAHILHQEGESTGYWQKQILLFDLKRAFNESHNATLILPSRTLQIIRNSGELHEILQHYKDAKHPAADIEARACIPFCIGLSFHPSHGFCIPLWNPNSTALWIALADFLSRHSIIGQNFGYDRDKIKRLGFIIRALKSDTMLKAFCINPELPKNLAFNTSIYTEEPYYKDEGMYEGSEQDLMIGCARDACVTKEIDIATDPDIDAMGLRKYYENFLLPLHDLYLHIENNGLNTDNSVREKLIKKYVEQDEKVRYELYKITGSYVNSNSWQQVSKQLYDVWNLPKRKTNEEDLTGLLNSKYIKHEEQREFINLILEDRRIKKTLSGHLTAPLDFDGKMRTSYFICLETGRSATTQQDPPIRPQVIALDENGKKKKRSLGTAFQTMTKHGDIGADVREQYVPSIGHIFLQADSSQAEARVIFLLAEDYDALKLIDTCDFHALTASWFFGGTELDYSKKVLGYESPIRFAGKTLRHAGHLGAKAKRASIECNTQARKYKIDIKISERQAEIALDVFHKKQPKIKGIFQAQVRECIDKNRRLIAPVPHGIDASIGGTRIFYERGGDELYRQAYSYLPQRTVSENTKSAALRIRKRANWINILGESHDALLCEVAIERANEAAIILKEEFEKPIDFSNCSLPRGMLTIPCEVEFGYNYFDMKKFKYEMVTR